MREIEVREREEMELDHIALIVSKEENLAFYKKLDKIPKISYYLVPFKQNKFYLIKSF